jgi:hypothetical protein
VPELILDGRLIIAQFVYVNQMVNNGAVMCWGDVSLYVNGTRFNKPTIRANIQNPVPPGSRLELDAGDGFDAYEWTPDGQTSQRIHAHHAKRFQVTITRDGCWAFSDEYLVVLYRNGTDGTDNDLWPTDDDDDDNGGVVDEEDDDDDDDDEDIDSTTTLLSLTPMSIALAVLLAVLVVFLLSIGILLLMRRRKRKLAQRKASAKAIIADPSIVSFAALTDQTLSDTESAYSEYDPLLRKSDKNNKNRNNNNKTTSMYESDREENEDDDGGEGDEENDYEVDRETKKKNNYGASDNNLSNNSKSVNFERNERK